MIYVIIAALVLLSAFFSGSEIAYTSVTRLRLENAAEDGRPGARVALWIYERYERALTTILLGNNLVNVAASALATLVFLQVITDSDLASLVATLVMTALVLVFGETIPKMLAKRVPTEYAHIAAAPLRILMFITFPIVVPISSFAGWMARLGHPDTDPDAVTEDDLASIIETVEDEGIIDEDRGELLQNALEFDDITAQEIMTPRVDMVAVDCDDTVDQILRTCDESGYTRIPVYEDSIDNIIGILYINRFYRELADNADVNIRDILLETCYVYKTMTLPAIMAALKKGKTHIAIVTDDFGGTMGVVTMEDVLEELVGDIWDETDEVEKEFTRVSNDTYEVSGDMNINDFTEAMDLAEGEIDSDSTTVGGWVLEQFNGFPQRGETFEYGKMKVTVERIDNRRIERIRVRREEETDRG